MYYETFDGCLLPFSNHLSNLEYFPSQCKQSMLLKKKPPLDEKKTVVYKMTCCAFSTYYLFINHKQNSQQLFSTLLWLSF